MKRASNLPWHTLQAASWSVAALCGALCVALAYFQTTQFFRAYLWAYLFWFGLAAGSLSLLMLYHVAGGAWGVLIRRLLEAASGTLPLMALLFVPVLFGLHSLYGWTDRAHVASDEVLRIKSAYLNVPFFVARTFLYFAVWIAFAFLLRHRRGVLMVDAETKPKGQFFQPLLSGWGLVLYCLTASFAAIDWVMSLEPKWNSTVFGMLFIVGHVLTALAALILFRWIIQKMGAPSPPPAQTKPWLDIGNLLLAFLMLWAYLSFMQFLVIWMGNKKEETVYYLNRNQGIWLAIAISLIAAHFALPFVLLLFRAMKRKPGRLAAAAAFILWMRVLDTLWQVGPDTYRHASNWSWLYPGLFLAMGGIWAGWFVGSMRAIVERKGWPAYEG